MRLTTRMASIGRQVRKAQWLAAVALLATLAVAGPARAAAHIDSFDYVSANADGTPSEQAGAHPYAVSTSFTFPAHDDGSGLLLPDESVRNLSVDLPVGLVGNPTATPVCGEQQLVLQACSPSTQVGYVSLTAPSSGLPPLTFPIFNMKAPPGVPAEFGFYPLNVAVHLQAKIRSGDDYGVTVTVKDLPQTLAWTATTLTFWGVPADSSHDGFRGSCLTFFGPSGDSCPSQAPRAAFLTNPSACTAVSTATAHVDSWQHTGVLDAARSSNQGSGGPAGITGCDRLHFDPTIAVRPGVRSAGSPAGFSFKLHVPQADNPDGLAEATLDRAVVTLPAGVSISPSSADGLGACSPAQIGLDDATEPDCPDSAKIGTVTIATPLLNDPLTGSIFVAKQGDNPFNSLLAIYVVASADGVVVKLAGHMELDPVTGQLRATFDHNPQLPFSDLQMEFKDGPRAPLANPESCGTYITTAQLTPYGDGPPVTSTDTFTIDSSCSRGFTPSFAAGTTNPAGGATTSFTLGVARSDGDEELSALAVTLPPGVLGNLDAVPLCPEAAAAAGTCDAASQIGTTTEGSGPGVNPFHLGGRVYLTGPYKGAPFGLSTVVPVLAGPFDLGLVVVRAAISVDPRTAAITVVSDPLPTILQGIPLRMRSVNVTIDRPGFLFNATSCSASQVAATISSTTGTQAQASSRYQAASCASLGYKPRLGLTLTGKGQTTDGKHPGLVAHLAPRGGDANSKKITTLLPLSLALDPNNANGLCEPADAAADHCPPASIVGSAKAVSVLHEPLSGPVYFVHGIRTDPKSGRQISTLPKLFIPLRGDGVRIDIGASSEVVDDRLVTTFDDLPDAPLRSVDLTVDGGKHGILVVSHTNICQANQDADGQFVGQNGKAATAVIRMTTPCGLGIEASSHTASTLRLTVGGLAAGKVTVSGHGLVALRRTIIGSSVATLQPRLSAGVKATLAHHGTVRLKVAVAFVPAGAKKAKVVHKTVTVRG